MSTTTRGSTEKRRAVHAPRHRPRPKVLLVQEANPSRSRSSDALRLRGREPTTTEDAEAALRLVADHQFAAILVDLSVPRFDALDVVSCLRSHPPTRAMPVLALTAVLTADVHELVTSRGCDEVLPRPTEADVIAHALCRLSERPPTPYPESH